MPWLERPTIGDASESALIKFMQPIEDVIYTRSQKALAKDCDGKEAKMPFNSTNKYAFIICEYETKESHYCLFTKGAPEKLWTLCNSVYDKGEVKMKNQDWEDAFKNINE